MPDFSELHTGEMSAALLASSTLLGLEEAHPEVLEDPELTEKLLRLTNELMRVWKERERAESGEKVKPVSESTPDPLAEETEIEDDDDFDDGAFEDDILVPLPRPPSGCRVLH